MKLHLPKSLLVAVLAACAFNQTVWAVAEGWYQENAGANYSYSVAGQNYTYQLGDIFYTRSGDNGDVDASVRDRNYVYIRHDVKDAVMDSDIGTLTLKQGQFLQLETSRWGDCKYDDLTIEKITGASSFDMVVHGAGSVINVKSIDGTVTNLRNDATLTVGSASSSTDYGTTIYNSGDITLSGTVTVSGDILRNFKIKDEGTVTYSYGNGNGFMTCTNAEFYLIENVGSGKISGFTEQSGFTVNEDGETITSVTFTLASTKDEYFHVAGEISESTLLADANAGVEASTKYSLRGGTLTVAGDISSDRLDFESGTLALGSHTLVINTTANAGELIGNTTGAGNIKIELENASAVVNASQNVGGIQITGTVDVTKGILYVGNPDGESGGADTNFKASKLIVRNGGEFYSHFGQGSLDGGTPKEIEAAVYLESGAKLANKDGCVKYTGNIHFNVADANAETPAYNADGTVFLYTFWNKYINLSGLVEGSGRVEFSSSSSDSYLGLTGDNNSFNGTYAVTSTNNGIVLGAQNAAQYATIELAGNNTFLQLNQNSTIKALNSTNATNVVKSDAAATLTVTGGSSGFSGTIGENITLALTGGTFIVNGSNYITNNGIIEIGDATVRAKANWNLHGTFNVTGKAAISGSAFYLENDCTLTMMDGSSLIREGEDNRAAYQIRGKVAVEEGATATLSTNDDIHFNHENSSSETQAVFSLGAGATLNLTAVSFQDYADGEKTGCVELGADSKLNITCGNFQVFNLDMHETSEIVLKEGTVMELKSTGNQDLKGSITLEGGTIQSSHGASDNRVKTIKKLSGSGEIIGTNWNVIWDIKELAGEGDITWKNEGTHYVPSVLKINGGTYTGTLTAMRETGKDPRSRGDYQSVLQINQGGKETLAGAVVNLDGRGTDAYVQMALNTDSVSVGGLEGTQYAHIYAGEADIEGGSDQELHLVNKKSTSTGTSVLKIATDTDHTYAGSMDAGISVEKSGIGTQEFSGDMSSFSGDISAMAGVLAFTATDALSVNSLNVANVGTLEVSSNSAAGTISTSNATLAGGATINANLTLNSDGALEMNGMDGDNSVTVNGTLTLGSGIALTGEITDALSSGKQAIKLFSGITELNFTAAEGATYSSSATVAYTEPVDFNDVFSVEGVDTSMYELTFSVDGTLWASQMNIPEPATATLSLLALAGLCARRRRKS